MMSWLHAIDEPSWQLHAKRAFDVATSAAALTLGAPLIAAITAAELAVHGWPPIFVQARPGFHGRVFHIYKFRSMREARGPDGSALPDAERLTNFGSFLRRTSLDEIPEFINVLRGEMSIVGPRPLMVEYLARYTDEQRRRHEMPPGLTGWAQVNGRNATSWKRRLEYDVQYVQEWSLAFDLRILWLTLGTVLSMRGISAEGSATMPPFTGDNDASDGPE